MLPAVFRTEEREKEVLFSNLPMGTLYVTLNVRVDDKRYGYEDFSSFQGMRVGIIRGSSDGERFQRYCEKFGVKPIIVPYAETQDVYKRQGSYAATTTSACLRNASSSLVKTGCCAMLTAKYLSYSRII